MLRIVILGLALIGTSLAYRQHGYSTEVKHIIPAKIVEESVEGGQQEGAGGNPEDGIVLVLLGGGQEGIEQQGLAEGIEGTGAVSEEGGEGGQQAQEDQRQQQEDDGSYKGQQQDFFAGDWLAYPKYKYDYGVKDYHTGDHKSHWEIRDGDLVKGEYALLEPDGSHRIVRYKADDKTGFQAEVKQIGKALEYGGGYSEVQRESQQGEQGEYVGDSAYSYSKLKRYL